MARLVLESHCESRPAPPEFAADWGFTAVEWLAPPVLGVAIRARVGPPFFAELGGTLLTYHLPECVSANGWEPDYAEQLSSMRLVRCQLTSIGEVAEAWGRPARMVELLPTEILDPRDAPGSVVPTDLVGTLLEPNPREKLVLVGSDRILVQSTMQGDVTFAFWLRTDRPEIFLLEDTSICQGYFYSGRGLLAPELYEKLIRAE